MKLEKSTKQNFRPFNFFLTLPKKTIIGIIYIYQKTFSPDHGWFKGRYPYGYCRYYPTCSEYGVQAIEKFGLVVGLIKTFGRVMRCNPWSKGGVDLP